MNGAQLAATLGIDATIRQISIDDGRASVVAAYTIGDSSLLVSDALAFRDPGSNSFFVHVRPRVIGDGPTYAIPNAVLRTFVGGADLDAMIDASKFSGELLNADRQTAYLDRDTAVAFGQSPRNDVDTVGSDLVTAVKESPATLGRAVGAVAGGIVRTATSVAGGAAGSFLGALPVPLVVGLGLAAVGVAAVGAVLLVREVRAVLK